MKWFRSHIKQGSRLALLALAIQFVLAFGHFHGVAAQAASATGSVVAPSVLAHADAGQPSGNHEPDRQAHDGCAICAVIALANAALHSAPPVLSPPQAAAFSYLSSEAAFVHLNAARVVFQPRAPPIS